RDDGGAARARSRVRRGLRRPLEEGAADPGGQARRADNGHRRRRRDADPPSRRRRIDDSRATRGYPRRMIWRDLRCGEARPDHEGRPVPLAGWAARRRDHGGLVFIDLRDETGTTQLVLNPENAPKATAVAHGVRTEFVLQARGTIVRRSPETVNPKMQTGEVEVQVEELTVLSTCPPLPFQLDEENVDEALRMKYRWLDLRREHMQRNIRVRAQLVRIIREEMESEGFVDIETPMLWKPTPEGARDFVVPS